MVEQFDLIVIGSGPAGASGAAQAAALGKRVALVEREPHLGGSGINTGTMPSKMLRETAAALAGLRQRGLYGVQVTLQPGLTVGDLLFRKDVVVEGAWGPIQRNLERLHIRIVRGSARLRDAHTVLVQRQSEEGPDEVELRGRKLLIATGASPRRPEGIPFEHPRVLDAETILSLDRIPRSLLVCGGGTIGCEYAAIFNALGTQVTLVEEQPRVLTYVDGEVALRWQRHQGQQGMQFVFGAAAAGVAVTAGPAGDQVEVRLTGGPSLTAEAVLYALGREGNLRGLELEAAGVRLEANTQIAVNEHYQTSVPNIYAAGDVLGFPALASTSMEQARAAVQHAFDGPRRPQAAVYPLGVYTIPEIAMVGLAEEACQAQGQPYLVGRALFERNPRAQISGDTSGLLKLVFAPEDRRLLGVHILSEQASELIHLGSQVVAQGGRLDDLAQAVYNYPTLSEAYKAAAYDGLERWQARQTGLGER